MYSNSADVLRKLPDYDEMIKLSKEIAGLTLRKLLLEAEIKSAESFVFRVASTDEKYFQGGKPPSVAYIESTYKHVGLDGTLIVQRRELAEVISLLEEKRIVLDVYKSLIDIWRTLASSERVSSL